MKDAWPSAKISVKIFEDSVFVKINPCQNYTLKGNKKLWRKKVIVPLYTYDAMNRVNNSNVNDTPRASGIHIRPTTHVPGIAISYNICVICHIDYLIFFSLEDVVLNKITTTANRRSCT